MTTPHGQMYIAPYDAGPWVTAYQGAEIKTYTYAEIWSGMQPFSTLLGPAEIILLAGLKVTAGSVSIDRTNSIRRTATNVTMLPDANGALMPIANTGLGVYAPYGYEMRLFKGYIDPAVTPAFAHVTAGSAPTLPHTVTLHSNDLFQYTPIATGVPVSYQVPAGTYSTIAALAAAMAASTSVFGPPFSSACQVIVNATKLELLSLSQSATQNGDTVTTGISHDALAGLGFSSPSTLAGGVAPGPVAALGVFLIKDVLVNDDGTGVTLVGTMDDRGQWLSRRKFQRPYSTNGTDTTDVVITSLLSFVVNPTYAFPFSTSFTATTYKPPVAHYNLGDDPWKACCDLAAASGMQLYFDYNGVLILEPIPDPTTVASCVTYNEGTSSAPNTIARDISNDQVPNIICIKGQGSGVTTPIQVFWWDSSSSSPTFYAAPPGGGGFIPTNPQTVLPAQASTAVYPALLQPIDTSLVTSKPQAAAMAIAVGLIAVGSLEKATTTIRDNPAHDVDDVITFGRVIAGIPTSTEYVVDHVQVDLGPGTELALDVRPVP